MSTHTHSLPGMASGVPIPAVRGGRCRPSVRYDIRERNNAAVWGFGCVPGFSRVETRKRDGRALARVVVTLGCILIIFLGESGGKLSACLRFDMDMAKTIRFAWLSFVPALRPARLRERLDDDVVG